jgi:hypothetical protein
MTGMPVGSTSWTSGPYHRGPPVVVCNKLNAEGARGFNPIKVIAALDTARLAGPWTCRPPLAILATHLVCQRFTA